MNTQWIFKLLDYDPHLSAVSFLINSIHLVVLVQKTMRTSSTNVILLGIAISNLLYMAYPVIDWMKRVYDNTKECILPDPYAYVFFQWIYFSVQDDVRRCDAFLGLAMAFIRTFVLKFPMKSDTATSVTFGWNSCIILFLLSSIFSIAYFLKIEIGLMDLSFWDSGCSNETSNIAYTLVASELSMWNNYLFSKIQVMLDGIFSKTPTKTSSSKNFKISSFRLNFKSSTTTKLVLFNTISYMISALPSGILYVLYSFNAKWCNKVECYNYIHLMTFLTSIITMTHFPICLAMSTQYRSTVLGLLRIKKKSGTTVIKASAISRKEVSVATN